MRRTAGGWTEISWPEAFDEVERRIGEVRARHGNDAVAIYAGNPVVHNLGAMLGVGDFIRSVRTRNVYSATSVDQLPHMMASQMMFGHQFLVPVAVHSRDTNALEKSAHKLKGAVAKFGNNTVFKAALSLEMMGRENRLEDVEEAYGALTMEAARLVKALRNFIKSK